MDTLSLKLSTILIDSITSNSPGNFLVGEYVDEYLGKVSSTAYFQVDKPVYSEVDKDVVFDSLTLILNYNNLSYGDTTKEQTINVHEVLEDIKGIDNSYFYNTSKFKYSDTPLGSLKFVPRPNKDDTLEIRLNNEMGETLLQMMKDNADEISTSEDFLDYFKGVALVPGNEDASILAFDTTATINLYTHLVGQNYTRTRYKFSIYAQDSTFNNIQSDRSGTLVDKLSTQKIEIPSGETDNKSFIQGGVGIVTRLDFTGLEKVMEIEASNILYKAELILRPYPYSDKQIDFPEKLMLYTTNQYNWLISEIEDDENSTLYSDFYFDNQYREDVYYTFDITDFIYTELSDGYFNSENGLIISLPSDDFQSTAERLVFDARAGNSYRPVLKLYFVYYD